MSDSCEKCGECCKLGLPVILESGEENYIKNKTGSSEWPEKLVFHFNYEEGSNEDLEACHTGKGIYIIQNTAILPQLNGGKKECRFLEGNECSIHDNKPKACRRANCQDQELKEFLNGYSHINLERF